MRSVAARTFQHILVCSLRQIDGGILMTGGAVNRVEFLGMRKVCHTFQISMTFHAGQRGMAAAGQRIWRYAEGLHGAVFQGTRQRCITMTFETRIIRACKCQACTLRETD